MYALFSIFTVNEQKQILHKERTRNARPYDLILKGEGDRVSGGRVIFLFVKVKNSL